MEKKNITNKSNKMYNGINKAESHKFEAGKRYTINWTGEKYVVNDTIEVVSRTENQIVYNLCNSAYPEYRLSPNKTAHIRNCGGVETIEVHSPYWSVYSANNKVA